MVSVAERLGEEFPFVRVDMYDVDGEVYVGELTFTPTAGLHPFDPPETDLLLGRLWRKPRRFSGGASRDPLPEVEPVRVAP